MAIEINIESGADGATVAVGGYLNANTSPDLEAQLAPVLDGCANVTFDFSGLEYISSAGLRVLMGAYKRTVAAGGSIRVTGASDEVREVFEITGFTELFEVA